MAQKFKSFTSRTTAPRAALKNCSTSYLKGAAPQGMSLTRPPSIFCTWGVNIVKELLFWFEDKTLTILNAKHEIYVICSIYLSKDDIIPETVVSDNSSFNLSSLRSKSPVKQVTFHCTCFHLRNMYEPLAAVQGFDNTILQVRNNKTAPTTFW